MRTLIRPAVDSDFTRIAAIWEAGWHEAHDHRVPDALKRVRTPAAFAARARDDVASTTVAVVDGIIAGFVVVDRDEIQHI